LIFFRAITALAVETTVRSKIKSFCALFITLQFFSF
jgi:hypothetical protein